MKRWVYPFSAIVEQEALKAALLLNAVDPLIGGVLIRGQKGTGKSTAARALSLMLPQIEMVEGCPYNSDPASPFAGDAESLATASTRLRRPMPFVELPLNATEDRLAGTLQIEKVLQTGRRQFEPGLLAAANRGVLYVDEVNLLDDHLVDLLLDAAVSGVNVVEREGLSFAHPARFLLIGTMNPEEGELRPQFLDRFGLCVAVHRVTNIPARETIVRRRMAFDAAPERFLREWEDADRQAGRQIEIARSRLEQVEIPDSLLTVTAKLTHELHAAGHRADITLVKAARAHAAFLEKKAVQLDDLLAAAGLALPHRMASSLLDSPEQLQDRIRHVLQQLTGVESADEPLGPEEGAVEAAPADLDLEDMAAQMQVPGSAAAGSVMFSFLKKKTRKLSSSPTSV
jgi:magnesium chelatase subunit I